MTEQATYKNINATVRPPRCAILINKKTRHWKAAVNAAIMQASQVWGGQYFLLVPTDGDEIDAKFWELLEAYSPDYIATCDPTFADLEDTDPKRYQEVKRSHQADWHTKGAPADGFDDWFYQGARATRLDQLEISETLDKEIAYRLAPFYHGKAVSVHLTQAMGFGYPFTRIAKIVSTTTRHIGRIVLPPKSAGSSALSLLLHSQTGLGGDEYCTEMRNEGFMASVVADNCILRLLYNLLARKQQPIKDGSGELLDNWAAGSPFALSMLHLGNYYVAGQHLDYKEPVVVVVGDSVDDFCLYYSLSRIHNDILWLPATWLRAHTSRMNELRKLRDRGGESPPLSLEQSAAREVTNIAFDLINYGHSEKRIQLCSMSLSKHQLIAYRSQMARASVGGSDGFSEKSDCVSVEAVSTSCIGRVFEQDNYANNRPAVFVNGESVSPIETPKPKSFSEIVLPGHYWMTSLHIEGYQPPPLPGLGPKMIHGATTQSRIASDGLAYVCPNPMIFGRDLDALLVRPRIKMMDTVALFNNYFEDVDVTVGYSDKGNYFYDTVRRFGGLRALGEFIKVATTRSIMDKFMAEENAESGNVIFLENDRRAYLNLAAVAASLGNEEAAADLLDHLVDKEVLQRGYIFRCERCRLSSWYALDGLTAEFVCSRCSLSQKYTRKHWKIPLVPHWYYRLAETIYQFYYNNSHLTAQVLYKLKLESKMSFMYAPEIDLMGFPNLGKGQREMDVACILDGEIIFGECKTTSLVGKDVEKFETLISMPVRNPARIIFATTQSVSVKVRDRINGLPNAVILVREDLYED